MTGFVEREENNALDACRVILYIIYGLLKNIITLRREWIVCEKETFD